MDDFLEVLARDVRKTIDSGYYETVTHAASARVSLKEAILESKDAPVIAEIKAASPSAGVIRREIEAAEIATAMEKGGAVGISVLTEPTHFQGSLNSLADARKAVRLPILMKDIILSPVQLVAASKMGANAVLLIQAIFDRRNSECTIEEMIKEAHSRKLEVLLETHNQHEFHSAISSEADLIGINNRDLGTLNVDLNVTRRVLQKCDSKGKIIVSESGINTPADIRFLSSCGAHAFLVGSAVMRANNIEEKIKELVQSL